MRENLRGVQQFAQPNPKRNPGGDCFACALKATIDHLFPERPITFDQAWECFLRPGYRASDDKPEKKVLSNTWPTMANNVQWALKDLGYRIDVHQDIVLPEINLERDSYYWGARPSEQNWAKRLDAWLSAGWIALAEISYNRQLGPNNAEGLKNHIDHFVVLDGQREFWKLRYIETGEGETYRKSKSASMKYETHIVCSAKGSYWIDTEELMWNHGANALILMRRDETWDQSVWDNG